MATSIWCGSWPTRMPSAPSSMVHHSLFGSRSSRPRSHSLPVVGTGRRQAACRVRRRARIRTVGPALVAFAAQCLRPTASIGECCLSPLPGVTGCEGIRRCGSNPSNNPACPLPPPPSPPPGPPPGRERCSVPADSPLTPFNETVSTSTSLSLCPHQH